MNHIRIRKSFVVALVSSVALSAGALAGSLTPPGAVGATMHSLTELYDSIAGTFDSSAIVANQNGSLIQQLKYINANLGWASGSNNIWSLNSGNVGIGETNPTAKLEVRGTASISNGFFVSALGATGTGQVYIPGGVPTLVGSAIVSTLSGATDLYVQGKYAYVAFKNEFSTPNGLLVFDVSNPATPTQTGTMNIPGGGNEPAPEGVYVQGKYAYLAGTVGNALVVADISNPTSPSFVGYYPDGQNPRGIAGQGRYVYVGHSGGGEPQFTVWDVANVTNPSRVGQLSLAGCQSHVRCLFPYGKYLYLATSTGLRILDVSNPSIPKVLSTTTITSGRTVFVQGRYAYVGTAEPALKIYDVSNPAAPSLISNTVVSGTVSNIQVRGRYLYAASGSSIVVYDISNAASPVFIGSVATSGTPQIFVLGRYLYAADASGTALRVYDLGGTYAQSLEAGTAEIGDATLRNNLEVNGRADLRGGLGIGGDAFISGTLGIYASTSNAFQLTSRVNADLVLHSFDARSSRSVDGKFTIRASGSAGVDSLRVLNGSGTALMTIASLGNVGIGTTGPQKALHLVSTQDVPLRIEAPGAPGIEFYNGATFRGTVDAGATSISVFNQNLQGLTIFHTGRAGLFTTSPDQTLDVTGNIAASTSGNVDLILNSSSNQDGRYAIRTLSTGAGLQVLGSASQALMTIASSGNVGIGTNNTWAKLAVRGGIAADSIILASSSGGTITAQSGFGGFINFSGGIGTGGAHSLATPRLDQYGNLFNIGGIQAGEAWLTRGGTLSSVRTYAVTLSPNGTGGGIQDIGVGDVTGDGAIDVVSANSTTRTVTVLINGGGGLFTSSTSYTMPAQPWSAALGDFNGDGMNDIVVANNVATASFTVLFNSGNGIFASSTSYSGIKRVTVVVRDFNGDGKLDVALAGGTGGETTVSVFLNKGSGSFLGEAIYDTGSSATFTKIAAADVNGDGKIDLVTSNRASLTVSVLINRGNGTFVSGVTYSTGSSYTAESVTTGDLNADNYPDIAVINNGSGPNNVSVFLNNGNGTFASAVVYSMAGLDARGIAIGDMDGDGKADIVVGGGGATIFFNDGIGGFGKSINKSGGSGNIATTRLADLNKDGKLDVVNGRNVGGQAQNVDIFLDAPKTILYAQASTGRVAVGTSLSWSKFSITDLLPGSATSGSFAIRSSNTIASVVSISGTSLTTGTVMRFSVPTSASQPGVDYLVIRDTTGQVYASLGAGGELTLRRNIFSHGAVSNCTGANTPTQGCIDYAESFPTTDTSLQAGEVVALSEAEGPAYVKRADGSSTVIGIVSTNPAALIDGNAFKSGTAAVPSQGHVAVALAGRVPAKISDENGPIVPGDHLTTAATQPGYAMKQTAPGMSVGIALEGTLSGVEGQRIMVFVNTSYWMPDIPTVAVASSSGGPSFSIENIFTSIIQMFKDLLGIGFEENKVQAERVQTKSVQLDGDDGNPYCIRVVGGQLQSTSGTCDSATPTPIATPTPSETPMASESPSPLPSETPVASEPMDSGAPSPSPSLEVTPTPEVTPEPTPEATP